MDGLDTSFVVDVVADGRRWWLVVGGWWLVVVCWRLASSALG